MQHRVVLLWAPFVHLGQCKIWQRQMCISCIAVILLVVLLVVRLARPSPMRCITLITPPRSIYTRWSLLRMKRHGKCRAPHFPRRLMGHLNTHAQTVLSLCPTSKSILTMHQTALYTQIGMLQPHQEQPLVTQQATARPPDHLCMDV